MTINRFIDKHIKWVFALPALVFMLVMVAAPLIMTLGISLTEWNLLTGKAPVFNKGLNYIQALKSREFWNAFVITFYYTGLAALAELFLGLSIALVLNREFRWKNTAKTIVLLPYMMAPVAVGLMWTLFYEPSSGLINFIFQTLKLPPSVFTSAKETVIPAIAAVEIWQMTPMVIIVCLAGLSSLPTDPLEAARVDGASGAQVFFYAILPMMMPTIFAIGLLRFIDVFKSFDLIYSMTKGGPANASRTINLYAYETGFSYYRFGLSSTILMLLFFVVLLVCLIVIRMQNRWVKNLD